MVIAPLLFSIALASILVATSAATPGGLADPTGDGAATAAPADPESPPPIDAEVSLVVRDASDRSAPPRPLEGATLRGAVLISVVPAERIRRARFHLDDPELSTPHRSESKPPFDFEGGEPDSPVPWDTRRVADGPHEITVVLDLAGGGTERRTARFEIANSPPVLRFAPASLHLHARSGAGGARSIEVSLEGEPGTSFAIVDGAPAWLAIEPLSGELPAVLRLAIRSAELPIGRHTATIGARAGGESRAELAIRVDVHGPEQAFARSVERHGIVWRFDGEVPVGRFVGGDPWVLGPLRIESVTPEWTGVLHGSMVNPRYGTAHGYDSRFNFDEGLRARFPREARPGESIVSVESWRPDDPKAPSSDNTLGIPRPALRSAAVLTVLDAPPPEDSFRPPYAGAEKPLHRVADLHPEILPSLPAVPGAPGLRELEARFERLWLDHTAKWENRFLHPSENMPDYCRDLARDIGDGSLMLLLDRPLEERRTLMIRLVQIGIDMHAVVRSGATWGDGGGGFGSGRKWAILLAGLLLDDPAMKAIGRDYGPEIALEDCQTFHLTEADLPNYPGVPLGHPVWGERHCRPSGKYVDPGNLGYRRCCTATAWVGAVLSAHILGARELWDHEPLFDYQDWYMATEARGTRERALSEFAEAMWDRYRADYGPVWSRD